MDIFIKFTPIWYLIWKPLEYEFSEHFKISLEMFLCAIITRLHPGVGLSLNYNRNGRDVVIC